MYMQAKLHPLLQVRSLSSVGEAELAYTLLTLNYTLSREQTGRLPALFPLNMLAVNIG